MQCRRSPNARSYTGDPSKAFSGLDINRFSSTNHPDITHYLEFLMESENSFAETGNNFDINQVRAEIEAEAAEWRRNDPHMARLEREVMQAWSDIAPPGAIDEQLYLLESLERLAKLNVDPSISGRWSFRQVKKLIRKANRWHLQHLANQIELLFNIQVNYLRQAEKRLSQIERLYNFEATSLNFLSAQEEPSIKTAAVVANFVADNKCLVISCGEGTIVEAICDIGGDAYGIDDDPSKILPGIMKGLDLRSVDMFEHLDDIRDQELGSIVLSSIIDDLSAPILIYLVSELTRVIQRPGRVMILTRNQQYSATAFAELYIQRGLSSDGWIHLLQRAGFSASLVSSPELSEYTLILAELE